MNTKERQQKIKIEVSGYDAMLKFVEDSKFLRKAIDAVVKECSEKGWKFERKRKT